MPIICEIPVRLINLSIRMNKILSTKIYLSKSIRIFSYLIKIPSWVKNKNQAQEYESCVVARTSFDNDNAVVAI